MQKRVEGGAGGAMRPRRGLGLRDNFTGKRETPKGWVRRVRELKLWLNLVKYRGLWGVF